MSKQERVSSIQMSMLFLFFVTGSSIVIIPAPLTNVAGNGAWISLLIAVAMGMVLLAGILYLYRQFPSKSLIEYSRFTLGNGLTILLLIPFTCVMFWNVAGIVIEIGLFFKSTMLKETPTYAVNSLFFVTIALTVLAGIEVIARMTAVFLTLMFGFIIIVLVLVGTLYHPEYLLPVLPDGIRPILNAAYIAYGFPYSELVVFAIILPLVRNEDTSKVGKHLFVALIVNAMTLLASIICSIMVLGPLSGDLKYSLYQLARLIFVQDIIERIESVIGFSLIVGFYFKASILLLILIRVLAQMLRLENERLLVFPAAFICLLLSLTTYTKEAELEEIVNIIWPLLNNIAYVLPLLLIFGVTLFRSRNSRNKNQD
ncbi:germination protein [Paenibacillus baekrokdamisoli]|uniref:Germination protein n=1 Tax=Paenibacillus baekrokdamisoli TaxID=1712516 RepID=A0A3G9IPF6_9BACL|nr:endospore germination permease [Paenibacillus baekrokdamisoli]MBB3072762.1 spore germination protein KB [Paenibacillus baekrokdamisoli]BBH20152.1 germination protein [Paenibacillus baekrokdamisoli]